MMATDYRMITFEGDLDEVTRKFNAWASGEDGVAIISVQCMPLTFDTYANRHGVIVFYKKAVCKVEKLTPKEAYTKHMREMDPLTIFDPLIDRLDEEDDKPAKQSAPNALDSEIGQETLKDISCKLTAIADAMSFGYCSRCQGPVREFKHDIYELKRLLGWEEDKTIEYAGDGNTTWRTEMKEENKND